MGWLISYEGYVDIANLSIKIPNDLWEELKNQNIIDERCALPSTE